MLVVVKVYWDDDNHEIEALSFPVYIIAKTIDQLGGVVFQCSLNSTVAHHKL